MTTTEARPAVARRHAPTAEVAVPRGCVLTNGGFTVVLTAYGTGFAFSAAHGGVALTRWAGDRVEDRDGALIYLRDCDSGEVWSAAWEPIGPAAAYQVAWRPGRYTLERREHGIASRLEIGVAPDAPLEIRRLTLTNTTRRERRIEITSYVEVVLQHPAADAAHPAFSKLFVQTEWAPEEQALLARRRPRAPEDHHPWLVHALRGVGRPQWETDRERFLGRGRGLASPRALASRARLSGTTGNVLDPIVSLRRTLRLAPGASATVHLVLGAGADRDAALGLARIAPATLDRALDEAAHDARRALEREGVSEADAELAESRLVGRLIGDPAAGPAIADVAAALAALDLPALRREERSDGARHAALVSPASRGVARPPRRTAGTRARARAGEGERLRAFNGFGGFSRDGTEYVIRMAPRAGGGLELPPAPWVNVIANETFGTLVTDTGAACTWSGNSREHRLTPWCNDPLLDGGAETLLLRDEADRAWWSPLPGPAPAAAPYEMRHGFGYSVCRHDSHGLEQETWMFVARHDPVKYLRVRLVNRGGRARRLSLFACQRLVLGADARAARAITTRHDPVTGVLFAGAPGAEAFGGGVAFAAVVVPPGARVHVTADRRAYLGERGRADAPVAVTAGDTLGGATGAGLDPCFAQQVVLELPAGGVAECTFLLGEESSEAEALARVRAARARDAVRAALDETRDAWSQFVSRVRVRTPQPALDLVLNGWLAYQTLSCRLWARSAFYQSGGAYGYRDQLQDALALVMFAPGLARRQVLLHAGHQFVEGDVLHWWHPPIERGIRTRFADDRLWLPHLAMTYVDATGDWAVLGERVPYLEARPLAPGEDEAFLEPRQSRECGDVYEHCCRAIDRSLDTGVHGLPRFGTGDWNDGMNRVGREGRGESVWMGFFLVAILAAFARACDHRGDPERAARYRAHRARLVEALEREAWDGGWYRRGWYDDGAPLGSRKSDECRIDALAQAWAVISGAAPPARARRALDAVEEHLISERDGLVRLLDPPFEHTPHDPGYIKGYVPGVRENGGQYTHAALWVVRAMAELGRRDRAARLLEMLSPVSHTRTRRRAVAYRVEPYVVAADVYGAPPHVGRGGWTWYTGSAGWMLRVALESVLGVRWVGGDTLEIAPRVPDAWPGFEVRWEVPGGGASYEIHVRNPARRARGVVSATVDGAPAEVAHGVARIPVARDGGVRRVDVVLGS